MAQLNFDSLLHTGLDTIGRNFWALDHGIPKDYLKEYIEAAEGRGFSELKRISTLLLNEIPITPRVFLTPTAFKSFSTSPKKPFFEELSAVLDRFEAITQREFGNKEAPLLLNVKDSFGNQIRNLGCSPQNLPGLIHYFGKDRGYRLYVDMLESYATSVFNVNLDFRQMFDLSLDRETGADGLNQLAEDEFLSRVQKYQIAVNQKSPKPFPMQAEIQLIEALRAIFLNSKQGFREVFMFTNFDYTLYGKSSEGISFSRHPFTGESILYGTFVAGKTGQKTSLTNQQKRSEFEGSTLEELSPESVNELKHYLPKVVKTLGYDVEAEFITNTDGQIFFKDFHKAELSAKGSLISTLTLYTEGLLSPYDAAKRIEPQDVEVLLHDQLSEKSRQELSDVGSTGLTVSPGTVIGHVFLNMQEAITWNQNAKENGNPANIILITDELLIKDSEGLDIISGLVTRKGGTSSHAAVVARANGIPCVVGFQGLSVDHDANTIQINDREIKPGTLMTMEAANEGRLYFGRGELESNTDNQTIIKLTAKLFSRVLKEKNFPLEVRVNINRAKDVEVGLLFGAAAVGLCRTENMLTQPEAIREIRRIILLEDSSQSQDSLRKLEDLQRDGFRDIFRALNGREANIRLMDMPLHELMPKTDSEFNELWESIKGDSKIDRETLKSKVESFHESNPMLGLRACRFGITRPEIYDMQIRAILHAAYEIQSAGKVVAPGIMFPLVSTSQELARMRKRVFLLDEQVRNELGLTYQNRVPLRVGTMVELPSAAVQAKSLAPMSDFIAFGTNDLTQTTLGISRDDCMKYLPTYIEEGLLPDLPFDKLNPAVKEMIEFAVHRGRFVRKDTKFGICGEQGADPTTIDFCIDNGVDYLSCSPYRILPLRAAMVQKLLRQ